MLGGLIYRKLRNLVWRGELVNVPRFKKGNAYTVPRIINHHLFARVVRRKDLQSPGRQKDLAVIAIPEGSLIMEVSISFMKIRHRLARESDASFAAEEPSGGREASWSDVWKEVQQLLCFLGEARRLYSGGCDWDFAFSCMWRKLDLFFSEIVQVDENAIESFYAGYQVYVDGTSFR
jgi:hypothetical protein